MYRKFLNCILTGALFAGLLVTAVSCQDYDNDIKDLQSQITALSGDVAYLQSLIDAGKVVTDVYEDNGGLHITFSDGSDYYITNGKDGADGQNGQDGADADVWTIGSDGYWYVNGVLFTNSDFPDGVKAQGQDGKDGESGSAGTGGEKGDKGDKGDAGADGADGADGATIAMIPCPDDDGWFNLVQLAYSETSETWETVELIVEHYYQFAVTSDEGGNTGDDNTLYAIWDGNTLTLYNVKVPVYDANGDLAGYEYIDYVLALGNPLGSVAFVPDYIDSETGYPTTAPFVTMNYYLDETEVDSSTGEFVPQSGLGLSNGLTLVYRLNPSNAYVEDANYEFVNRNVQMRSGSAVDGDMQTLLNVEGAVHSGETVTISASVNTDAFSESGADLAALRVWIGTDQVVTSDYIVVKNDTASATPVIVDTTVTVVGEAGVPFYTRTKGFGDAGETTTETSAFIHEFVCGVDEYGDAVAEPELDPDTETDKNGLVNCQFAYDAELDLTELVGLYSDEVLAYVADLGITGISYTFAIPGDYTLADGVNQQEYIKFADDAHTTVTASQGTLSVDKFPVVRCDAFIGEHLVASTYILLQITGEELEPVWFPLNGYKVESEDDIEVNSAGDDDAITPTGSYHAFANYRLVNGGTDGAGSYTWTNIIDLTGEEFLADIQTLGFETLDEFWTYYDKNYFAMYVPYINEEDLDAVTHDPAKIATEWDGMVKWKCNGDAPNGGFYPGTDKLGYYHNDNGLIFGANIGAADDELALRIAIDHMILTQHTYTDVTCSVCGSHGAEYLLRMTFEPENASVTPQVNFFAFLHVYDDCASRTINPAYKLTDPENYNDEDCPFYQLDADSEAIVVKGNVNGGKWELTTDVTEHFTGGDVFSTSTPDDYGKYENNVKDVEFDWSDEYLVDEEDETLGYWVTPDYGTGIDGSSTVTTVGMATEIAYPYMVFGMDCNEVLTNGELCPYSYYIVFIRPFVAGEDGEVAIVDALSETGVTANLGEGVTVTDNSGNVILYWDADEENDGADAGFVLSSTATDDYYITDDMVTVEYDFDEDDEGYQELIAEVGEGALSIDTTTGEVTWLNGGAALMKEYTVSVKVTVTFENICKVECAVKVTLSPAN